MCLLLAPVLVGFFSFSFFLLQPLTVLMKQTRQAVCAIKQTILLRCVWGRLRIVDLLILTSLDQLAFITANIIYYFPKQATLMRRLTVLSLPIHLVFPGLTRLLIGL